MYANGFITLSTAPARDLVSNLSSALINTGWTLVTSNLVVTNYVHNVFLSNGANNSIGTNWFLDLGYDGAGAGSNVNVAMTVFSSWNVGGSNLASGFSPGQGTGSVTPNVNFQYGVSANTLLANTSVQCNLNYHQLGNINVNTSYWITATIDRLIFTTANTTLITPVLTGGGYYIGTYDSFMSLTQDKLPIVAANLSTTTGPDARTLFTSSAFFITEPAPLITGVAGTFLGTVGGILTGGSAAGLPWNTIGNIDNYQQHNPIARIPLIGRTSTSGAGSSGTRGLYKDLYVASDSNGVPLHGDLITWSIGANNYTAVMCSPGLFNSPYGASFAWFLQT